MSVGEARVVEAVVARPRLHPHGDGLAGRHADDGLDAVAGPAHEGRAQIFAGEEKQLIPFPHQ